MTDGSTLTESAAQRPLVLVADDDESICSLIVEVLGQIGVGALVANNGAVAVQLVVEHGAALCCAILDVRMPVLDGLDAAREIRQIAPNLAIVVMSSHFPGEYWQRLAPLRIAHILDKPFHLNELRAVVHRISVASPHGVQYGARL